MKSPSEWYNQMGSSEEYTAMWQSHMENLIKQIQIDALKEGLLRAAQITRKYYAHGYKYSVTADYNNAIGDVERALLSATKNTL